MIKTRVFWVAILVVHTAAGTALSPTATAKRLSSSSPPLAIENATIRGPKGTKRDITLVVINGTIRAMGTKVRVPPNATRINASGKIVTAGLVATCSQLGLVEVSAVTPTLTGSLSGSPPIHAAFRITDGYNPQSIMIPVARNGGITSTVSAPSGGFISGQSAWLTTGAGSTNDNLVKDGTAVHILLGQHASEMGNGSRGLALQRLRTLFDDAAHYRDHRAAYHRGQTRAYSAHHLDLEALLPVLRRQIPLVARVDRKSDIAALVGLARKLGIRLVVQGGTEAWMLTEELAAAKVAVILDPTANLPSSFDQIHVVDDLATRLVRGGVSVILYASGMGLSERARTLRQLLGISVAQGLTWEEAFATATLNPARVFGVKRGTLNIGAPADLVIWTGDPLELSTRAEHVIVNGVVQSPHSHQTELLRRYRQGPPDPMSGVP